MKNCEKYKSVNERAEAFDAFCDSHSSKCEGCPLYKACDDDSYAFAWLELEAEEEKPLPCPFCGSDSIFFGRSSNAVQIKCHCCGYSSELFKENEDAIAAHNRVARAVMAKKDKEAK